MDTLSELAIEKFKDELGSDVSHVRVTQKTNDNHRGFGSARTPQLALVKALSEYCERTAMRSQSDASTSNGFAAHRSTALASSAAIAELIERDAVLCSWFNYRRPEWLRDHDLPPNFQIFDTFGYVCRIGRLAVFNDIHVYVSLLYPKDESRFGCLFASAASTSSADAIETIYLNQRRNVSYALAYIARGESHIEAHEVISPDDHRKYYLNPARIDSWYWMLGKGSVLQVPHTKFNTTEITSNLQMPWRIHIARAEADPIQQYFSGPSLERRLNARRIHQYSSANGSAINMELHPLP